MSKFEKAQERILQCPKDYTYSEVKYLLSQMGFVEYSKGKTSGFRVKFFREVDDKIILLHKPHPGDIMSIGAVRTLVNYLKGIGEI